ncbi:hypothetical protein ACIPR9_16810 [Pectobacterium punjabense]|uniref:pPIWI-associating nuclease domain-containing protein n=1 Tax=Pectobacterium punjabense TaxID=2108399 RepID=UPI00380AE50C
MRNNANLELISRHLNDDFERRLFNAAIYNLSDENNDLRFSNYAYAFRELFLHVIKRMAPDNYVESCEWFSGLNEQGKVSRKDLYKYIIQGGISDCYIRDDLGIDISDVFPRLRDAFESLNRLTHISNTVFPIDASHGIQMTSQVEEYISSLFMRLDECHCQIITRLGEKVGNATIQSAISESLDSIDILSTHSSVEEIYVENIRIVEVNYEEIIFEATGSVDVGLQWGSNSDVRNDIGAVSERSFPFSCEVRSQVGEPEDVFCDEGAFTVDTSSWFEGYYDRE